LALSIARQRDHLRLDSSRAAVETAHERRRDHSLEQVHLWQSGTGPKNEPFTELNKPPESKNRDRKPPQRNLLKAIPSEGVAFIPKIAESRPPAHAEVSDEPRPYDKRVQPWAAFLPIPRYLFTVGFRLARRVTHSADDCGNNQSDDAEHQSDPKRRAEQFYRGFSADQHHHQDAGEQDDN
jgi:hypothetical protein